jgi:small subunit ribosomal protein S16
MAVVIRMKRTGRRNRPSYRITVADAAKPRDGRTIETLGQYDPASPIEDLRVSLNVERAQHWIASGALPSETVHTVFKDHGVYGDTPKVRKKRDRSGRKKATAKGTRRRTAQDERATRKEVRRKARIATKAAAKANAKSAESQA